MAIDIKKDIKRIYKKLLDNNKIKIGEHQYIKLENGEELKIYTDSTNYKIDDKFIFFSFDYQGYTFAFQNGEQFQLGFKCDLDIENIEDVLTDLDEEVNKYVRSKRVTIDGKDYILVPVKKEEKDEVPF